MRSWVANKTDMHQPHPQGFSLTASPIFFREKPWERGWTDTLWSLEIRSSETESRLLSSSEANFLNQERIGVLVKIVYLPIWSKIVDTALPLFNSYK